jgi:CDP-diacylglycerol--serine O-phosphatidyltransferase
MMPPVTPHTPPPANSSPNSTPPSDHNPPSRGIYLLPNLLTTGCLFSGFYSIVAAIDRNFALAGLAVFIAMVFDGLDGRVARWTRTESPFGKEYDSLADMVAFGVAPAVLVYQWGVTRIGEYGSEWRQFGWVIAFFYAACAALRLARFNTITAGGGDKRYFQGLPSPSAAATVAAFVWFFAKWREPGLPGLLLAFAVTGYAAALMVSSFSYLSLKQVDVNARVKYSYLGFVILPMLILISVDPPTMLFAMFASYATYGPVQWLVRRLRRSRPTPAS